VGKKLAYERFYWFHGQVKASLFPNATKLAEKFEISVKQAQRDIEFMRDRLGAPLAYRPERKGYELENERYELPPVWFKEDELIALCLALRLASTLPDKKLKRSLYELLEKFLAFRFMHVAPSLDTIKEKTSVKNVEYYKVEEATFRDVVGALFRNASLRISYYTPHKHETTERTIHPLHLLCYMGSWHLIAFCTLKNDFRDFALSRIRRIEMLSESVRLPGTLPPVREYLRKNFGVMAGRKSVEVILRFRPEVSEWISEQIWFIGQEVSENEDGSICLRFPVADLREVIKEVLRHGASVEVVGPSELRKEIRAEIQKMAKIYA
jgi:predicted DNA-binding transcriptional regulator YafY